MATSIAVHTFRREAERTERDAPKSGPRSPHRLSSFGSSKRMSRDGSRKERRLGNEHAMVNEVREDASNDAAPPPVPLVPLVHNVKRLVRTHTALMKIDAEADNSKRNSAQGKKPQLKKRWMIDPRYSKAAQGWDVCTMIALIFTAIITPFEARAPTSRPHSLPRSRTGRPPGAGVFSRCSNELEPGLVDVVFILDLILQFFLMYPASDSETGVRWVDSRKSIVKHYLNPCMFLSGSVGKTWFALDLFSILLTTIDFVTLYSGGEDSGVDLDALRVLRVLRALRLIKLVRLVRASRMFKRWECKLAINYSALALGKCIIGVVIVSHWFACIFALQTIFFDGVVGTTQVLGTVPPEYVNTWKGEFGYCFAVGELAEDGKVLEDECIDPWALYAASLYWAIMTITSIGYGDIHATPKNSAEQIITAVLMLAGGFLWGQVIGTFCGVIATFDPHGAEFRRNMDDLNVFMAQKHLPGDMCRRLREYFHQTKHLQMANAQRHLFRMMSPSLQGEVAWAASKRWLNRVPFLQTCSAAFKVELAMALDAKVYAPSEVAAGGSLYVIHRGVALYGARVLTAGKVWGEDVILLNPALRSTYCARAMNYLECYTMSRDSIFQIAEDYPDARRKIRRCALLMAIRRHMAQLAKNPGLMLNGGGETAGSGHPVMEASSLDLREQTFKVSQVSDLFKGDKSSDIKPLTRAPSASLSSMLMRGGLNSQELATAREERANQRGSEAVDELLASAAPRVDRCAPARSSESSGV